MTFFSYLLITFALTIQFITSSSISSFDDGPVPNKSTIDLSKHRAKRYSPDSEDRIIGGQYVKDISKYPFIVFVYRYTWIKPPKYEEGFCGGTLLSKTHVLTAAHCFKECNCTSFIDDDDCSNCTIYNKDDFTLYFGNIVPNNSKISRKIKTLHIHPKYKHEDSSHKCHGRFDITVLELSTPVRTSGRISPIKLPEPVTLGKDELTSTMTSSFFDTNKNCKILGWGGISMVDNRKFMTRQLKVASIPLIGHKRCINILLKNNRYEPGYEKKYPRGALCTDTSFCAKCPHNRNTCYKGDSGGPIICDGVQVGVTSWIDGERLVSNWVNAYARVDINVQWIKSKMSKKHARMQYEY